MKKGRQKKENIRSKIMQMTNIFVGARLPRPSVLLPDVVFQQDGYENDNILVEQFVGEGLVEPCEIPLPRGPLPPFFLRRARPSRS